MKVAVLAVQGAFIEHEKMLEKLGVECIELRKKEDLDKEFDGIILPGGESTVQGKLIKELGMEDEIKNKIKKGLPVLATCAGMILLAEEIANDDKVHLGLLPVKVKRNAYGRQLGAGTEGRDPIADIHAINRELDAYNPDLLKKPQVIAANKIDAIYGNENEIISALRAEFEEKEGIKVYPISAVSGQGVRELLFHVRELLAKCPKEAVVYEQEFDPALGFFKDEPYTITRAEDGAFVVEGPKIEKMLGYTNMDSEKGFLFFQKFLREQGILKELEEQGIQDGDTVRMYYNEFDYYK